MTGRAPATTHKGRRPLVTVGVPIYNEERFLARCLEDLVAQDYEKLEIIIADNNSTDATGAIADAFAQRHANVTVVHRPENIGAIANFGDLVARANGEFFFWAAADDRRSPRFVSRLVDELLRHPEVGVVHAGIELTEEATGERQFLIYRKDHPAHTHSFWRPKEPLTEMPRYGLAWAMAGGSPYYLFLYGLFRTEWLREMMPIPRRPMADMAFMLRYALKHPFAAVDDVLYFRLMRKATAQARSQEILKLWGRSGKRFKYALLNAWDITTDRRLSWQARALGPILSFRMLVVACLSTLMRGVRWFGSFFMTPDHLEATVRRLKRVPLFRRLMGF
jgi:glycosyltransferase involved in cell wall biosynthesis